MRLHHARPRPVLQAAVEIPPGPRRPDPAVPLVAAALALGVVLAAVFVMAFGGDSGPAPANVGVDDGARVAAAEATVASQRAHLASQRTALADVTDLGHRLTAALLASNTTVARLAARPAPTPQVVRTQTVRVVRVPVAASPSPSRTTVPTVRQVPAPAPTPSPAPLRPCPVRLLGVCLGGP